MSGKVLVVVMVVFLWEFKYF